jgi:hypothetical protein
LSMKCCIYETRAGARTGNVKRVRSKASVALLPKLAMTFAEH